MGHWWQSASSKERFALRHLWRNNDAMGRVPLMALVLAGKIDFNMGSDTPLSDLKIRSENFSMGPSPADLETPSTGIASGSSGLTALEDLPSSGNTAPIDTQTTDDSKAKNQPWHWPKHIVSFSPKNWWQILLGQRVDHPEEAAIPKVNPHVLERRDQARRVFDEVSDSLQEKREMSQPRRDKE